MSKENQALHDIKQVLVEILRWSRFQGMQQLRKILNQTLQKDAEKIIYENSDGRDSREIASLAGVSHQTVVNYWRKWAALGIVEPIKVRGGERYRRIFSLLYLGIEVPSVERRARASVTQGKE